MMQYGYFSEYPNMMQYNFGYQGPPGSLVNMPFNNFNNPFEQINARLNNLENKIKNIEQSINSNNNLNDDNSMYML